MQLLQQGHPEIMSAPLRYKSELQLIDSIEKLTRRVFPHPRHLILPIGDDAAAFQPSKGSLLLVSSDALIEGIHFDLEYFSAQDLGWKSLAVNLSDIAAMGGKPRLFTTSIGLPPELDPRFIHRFYQGMLKLALTFGVCLAGGDTCASSGGIFLDVTILGEVPYRQMITRSGACVGDIICVTGELGGSAIGLEIMQRHFSRIPHKSAHTLRQLRPSPRVEIGRWLAEHQMASAMIDLSDGLSMDLHRLAAKSNVGAFLEASDFPRPPVGPKLASMLTHSLLHYTLNGGEDYELLFTVPHKLKSRIPSSLHGIRITPIGEIIPRSRGCLMRVGGQTAKLLPRGFDHFRQREHRAE
jgi:thiamine-monophosphate kinase